MNSKEFISQFQERLEKEHLEFDIESCDLQYKHQDDLQEVRNQIKQVAEKLLYHWKTFPISLPPTVLDDILKHPNRDNHVLDQLFKTPTFDELAKVAFDENGRLKRLNDEQLKSIQLNGEFNIPSVTFPGQVHQWRLTKWLQIGSARTESTFFTGIALALKLLIVTAKNRIVSQRFSVRSAWNNLKKGFLLFFDLLVGVPHYQEISPMNFLREERLKYLVTELKVPAGEEKHLTDFCKFVERRVVMRLPKQNHVSPPYQFETASGLRIDLRLLDRTLMSLLYPVLTAIVYQEPSGWFTEYKKKMIADLRDKNLSDDELAQRVNEALMDTYLERVYEKILQSEHLEAISPGIGGLLVQQAQAVIVMQNVLEDCRQAQADYISKVEEELRLAYPIRSNVQAWLRDKLDEAREEYMDAHMWDAHGHSIKRCQEMTLLQSLYFLQRDLSFLKEKEPLLRQELSAAPKEASRTISHHMRIWLPRNWIIMQWTRSGSVRVETVVELEAELSSAADTQNDTNEKQWYSVSKHTVQEVSTRYFFWRWLNYIQRTWCAIWNLFYWCAVVIPFCSPVSWTALCSRNSFIPNYKVSQVNGHLYPDPSSETHSMISRLRALWRHARHSRERFESSVDSGFLDKSVTRHFNRIWNYVVKWALGSLGIVLIFPPLCIFASSFSILAGILTPFWVPVVTLLMQLATLLVYDFDSAEPHRNKILLFFEMFLWRFLLAGVGQALAASLSAALLFPLVAGIIALVAVIRRSIRWTWDQCCFHVVIKRRGRVPASDSFVARRIAGPGLAADYFYQLPAEHAFLAAQCLVETQRLAMIQAFVLEHIRQPEEEFRQFISHCFGPFSASLDASSNYKLLQDEAQRLSRQLEDMCQKSRTALYIQLLATQEKRKIKLREEALRTVLASLEEFLRTYCSAELFPFMMTAEETYWKQHGVDPGDWTALAARILSETFSENILVPLEETDQFFNLEVQHLDFGSFVSMVANAQPRDDLDLVTIELNSQGQSRIMMPFIDPEAFDPSSRLPCNFDGTRRRPWNLPPVSGADFGQFEVPCTVPSPSIVALVVYNRDHEEDPIIVQDLNEVAALQYASN